MHVDLQKSFCKLNGLRLQQGFLITVGDMQIWHFDVGMLIFKVTYMIL